MVGNGKRIHILTGVGLHPSDTETVMVGFVAQTKIARF